ncbi:MAG: hypothetical protein GY811_02305 [Myxococcales bacterium]|nr:hypothetical protein [Myxococcales bacterium]
MSTGSLRMSIRSNPPPAPNHPRRVSKARFAQVEFTQTKRCYEVRLEELTVGGAYVEFSGLTPPTRCIGEEVHVFVDVGADIEGERVAGTMAAQIVLLEPAAKNRRSRMLLMWAGCDPKAASVLDRLLTQQRAGLYDRPERASMLAA